MLSGCFEIKKLLMLLFYSMAHMQHQTKRISRLETREQNITRMNRWIHSFVVFAFFIVLVECGERWQCQHSNTPSAVVVTELYERGTAHALKHLNLSCRLAYSSLTFVNNQLQLQKIALTIINQLVTKGINTEYSNLGAYYVLGALTLVNDQAAIALPWLFQSVS